MLLSKRKIYIFCQEIFSILILFIFSAKNSFELSRKFPENHAYSTKGVLKWVGLDILFCFILSRSLPTMVIPSSSLLRWV